MKYAAFLYNESVKRRAQLTEPSSYHVCSVDIHGAVHLVDLPCKKPGLLSFNTMMHPLHIAISSSPLNAAGAWP
jgi:hypothetical protein